MAGKHDLLLDSEFKEQHPERWKQAQKAANGGTENDEQKTAKDPDWGDLIYLKNSSATLNFPGDRKISMSHTAQVRCFQKYSSWFR